MLTVVNDYQATLAWITVVADYRTKKTVATDLIVELPGSRVTVA